MGLRPEMDDENGLSAWVMWSTSKVAYIFWRQARSARWRPPSRWTPSEGIFS